MTDLLPSSLLAELAALNESAMPATLQVYRRTVGRNDKGESTVTEWAPQGPPVRCRFLWEGAQRTDSVVMERLEGGALATASVPLGTDIDDDDEVVVTSPDFQPGITIRFAVMGPIPKPDTYATALEVPLRTL